jgi:hypothetical protein
MLVQRVSRLTVLGHPIAWALSIFVLILAETAVDPPASAGLPSPRAAAHRRWPIFSLALPVDCADASEAQGATRVGT